jgi:hypothetical protein
MPYVLRLAPPGWAGAFIEIEFTDHQNTEFERNRDGIIAFLN